MLRTDKRFYYDTKVNFNFIIIIIIIIIIAIINIICFYVITFDLRNSINMVTTN